MHGISLSAQLSDDALTIDSTLQLSGGGTLGARVQGVSVGLKAFVQAGELKGEAPALTDVVVEV